MLARQVHTVKRPSQYAHRGKALVQEAEALNAAVIVLSPCERDFTANAYQRSMAKCAHPASVPSRPETTGAGRRAGTGAGLLEGSFAPCFCPLRKWY